MNTLNAEYYHSDDLREMNFRNVGDNVQIAKNCVIVGMSNISLGNNVRIDSFSSLICPSSSIDIGSFVHIGSHCILSASEGIQMHDFSALSHGVKIYTRNDDYSGLWMTNPTVPSEYTNVSGGEVILSKHVIVGSNSVILPDVVLEEGAAVGAQSLVSIDLQEWSIYSGSPVKKIKNRFKKILDLEKQLFNKLSTGIDKTSD
ncbi:acyltransferase [Vibrio fluvialis]|uniref:acyltransferase n=1 Tax=Vibrio fluvialis TaxID=676 RepID=UPI001EEB826E|nr:acyltransferase [Vibrio fluvialis]MCG6349093.1 acyltransferase [Vibrio fluvialis]